tara:strand:+ start:892 stop:1098 length:207 start_codon:yes stop_codon:yes gene_type:complete
LPFLNFWKREKQKEYLFLAPLFIHLRISKKVYFALLSINYYYTIFLKFYISKVIEKGAKRHYLTILDI